jgi:hypothetical protein
MLAVLIAEATIAPPNIVVLGITIQVPHPNLIPIGLILVVAYFLSGLISLTNPAPCPTLGVAKGGRHDR